MSVILKNLRLIVLVVIFAAVFNVGYKLYVVVGKSMNPTHNTGRLLVVDKKAYAFEEHERFDLVTANLNGESVVKRIVGMSGEKVRIKEGLIYIDDELLKGDMHGSGIIATDAGWGVNMAPVFVPEGFVWLIGDNRSYSWYGLVSIDKIVGKVF